MERFNFGSENETDLETGYITLDIEKVPETIIKKDHILEANLTPDTYQKWISSKTLATQAFRGYMAYLQDNLPIPNPYLSSSGRYRGMYKADFLTENNFILINSQRLKESSLDRLAATINHERFHALSLHQRVYHEEGSYETVSGLYLKSNSHLAREHHYTLSTKDIQMLLLNLEQAHDLEDIRLDDDKLSAYLDTKLASLPPHKQNKPNLLSLLKQFFYTAKAGYGYIEEDLVTLDPFFQNNLDESITEFLAASTIASYSEQSQLPGISNFNRDRAEKILAESNYYKNSVKWLNLFQTLSQENQTKLCHSLWRAKKLADPSQIIDFINSLLPKDAPKISTDSLFALNLDPFIQTIKDNIKKAQL